MFFRKPVQMGASTPDLGQQMAMAASPEVAPQQPVETRVRALLVNLEKSLQRFNNHLSIATTPPRATTASAHLTLFRSADAVEVVMSRQTAAGSSIYPMTLSVFSNETPNGIALSLVERGQTTKVFGAARPTMQTLSFKEDQLDKVVVAVQQAVATHLTSQEKETLDRLVWTNSYPDAPAPSPSGQ